ncbi:MAG: hypothetical protein R6U61_05975 [Thermoplasmata archaeon]
MTIAVVISLIGTASLYLYAASQEAEKVNIGDIDEEYVGALVETEGMVMDVFDFGSSMSIVIGDSDSKEEVDVFVGKNLISNMEDREDLIPGAVIWTKGRVELYEEDISINVEGPGELIIKEKAYSSFTPIESILENPGWYKGTNMKIKGEITFLRRYENQTILEISDLEGGYYDIYCSVERTSTDQYLLQGDPVVIKGEFDYNSRIGRWIIEGEILS